MTSSRDDKIDALFERTLNSIHQSPSQIKIDSGVFLADRSSQSNAVPSEELRSLLEEIANNVIRDKTNVTKNKAQQETTRVRYSAAVKTLFLETGGHNTDVEQEAEQDSLSVKPQARSSTPKNCEYLLTLFIPGSKADDIIGNLEELHEGWVKKFGKQRADRSYHVQVCLAILSHWSSFIRHLAIAVGGMFGLKYLTTLFRG